MSEKEKYSIEMRAGVPVLVGKGWCHPASGAEIWYAARVDALEVENKRLREALELHHEYEKLLGDELNEIVGLATVHGWKSHRFNDGEKLRKDIAAAEDALGKGKA